MFGKPKIPAVSAAEAEAAQQRGAILIDVREQAEWDEARIPGAAFHPMSAFNDWYSEIPKDSEVVVYCRSGSRSAKVIHALMTHANHTNLHNLTGGIIAWHNSGFPVEEA